MSQLVLDLEDINLEVAFPAAQPVLELQLVQEVLEVQLQAQPQLALELRYPVALDAAFLPYLVGPAGSETGLSPVFTWVDGELLTITYQDGSVKNLAYDAQGRLSTIDYVRAGLATIRRLFTYNPDGTLAAVAQSSV